MSKKKSGLTKVAKGIAFGDVSNYAVRNVLTEISRQLYGEFTQEQMEETMEHFGWCCPYTGKYLKDEYDNKTGNYATDHIYPQNRVWCGLNVKGNLVLVDKQANNAKKDKSADDFLLYDTDFLEDLDDDTRQTRLDKIKKFQNDNYYDPEKIKKAISGLLKAWYDKVRENQVSTIKETLDVLNSIGISPIVKTTSKVIVATKKVLEKDEFKKYLIDECGHSQGTANSYKGNRDKIMVEMGFSDTLELESHIEDAIDFCTIEKKKAHDIGDAKKKKHYNDCRSAIKKYKDFIGQTKEVD